MMPHCVRRLATPTSNFFRGEPFVIGHLDDFPLAWFQVLQELLRKPRCFRWFPPKGPRGAEFNCRLQVLPTIEVVRDKVAFPVQRPVIGVLKYPYFEYALAGVKIRHRSEHIEKNV